MRVAVFAAVLASVTLAVAPATARVRGKLCIPAAAIRAESATTDTDLILHAGADRAYVSHLSKPCDGLRAINSLARLKLTPHGGRLCAGDSFELVDPGSIAGAVGIGGDHGERTSCTFGPFEGMSEMIVPELMRR